MDTSLIQPSQDWSESSITLQSSDPHSNPEPDSSQMSLTTPNKRKQPASLRSDSSDTLIAGTSSHTADMADKDEPQASILSMGWEYTPDLPEVDDSIRAILSKNEPDKPHHKFFTSFSSEDRKIFAAFTVEPTTYSASNDDPLKLEVLIFKNNVKNRNEPATVTRLRSKAMGYQGVLEVVHTFNRIAQRTDTRPSLRFRNEITPITITVGQGKEKDETDSAEPEIDALDRLVASNLWEHRRDKSDWITYNRPPLSIFQMWYMFAQMACDLTPDIPLHE